MKTLGYRIARIFSDDPSPPQKMYKSERAAFAAAGRFGLRVGRPGRYTSTRVTDLPIPAGEDARGWDAYRLAHGIAAW